MGLEDLQRWQWAALGLLGGLALGGIKAFYGPDLDNGFARTLNSQREFENGVALPMDEQGNFRVGKIYDIKVHPKDSEGKVWLTFMQVGWGDTRGEGKARPTKFFITEPYKPIAQRPTEPKPDLTIREYLGDLKEKFPDAKVSYRFAWWEVPQYTVAMYGAGGLVLIGGIWPSVVGLMTGAGIGGPRKREKTMDLSRYGQSDSAAPSGASGAGMTDADKAQLAEMEDAMLANLGGFGAGQRESDSVDEDAAAVVKPLTGGKLDAGSAAAASRVADPENKEYKGDFYPVARPGGKKDDE